MLKPRYVISSRLLANIKRITQLVTDLNNKHFPRVVLLDFERRARAISAHSSTSIEGNPLPLTEVKRILKHTPEHIRDSEREVLNYNQALLALNEMVRGSTTGVTVELILKIHRMVLERLAHPSKIGKLRQEPVFVNNPRTRTPIYLPPDH